MKLKKIDRLTVKCWRLAPAYDLTLFAAGYNGEHATSVNGNGHPIRSDFLAVGTGINIPESRCRQLIDEVTAGCADLLSYPV